MFYNSDANGMASGIVFKYLMQNKIKKYIYVLKKK